MAQKPKVMKLIPKSKAPIIAVPEPYNETMKKFQSTFHQLQLQIQDLQLRFTIESQNAALDAGLSKQDLDERNLTQDPTENWIWALIKPEVAEKSE